MHADALSAPPWPPDVAVTRPPWHSTELRSHLKDPTFPVDDDTFVVLERFQVIQLLGHAAW